MLMFLFFPQEKDIPTSEFHYDNMVSTVMNLFLAGTETSSSTIRYALGVLIKHPKIQGRAPAPQINERVINIEV